MRRKRQNAPDALQLLPRHDGRTPAPPIRPLFLRFVKRTGRFTPCTEDDPRGTIRTYADAAGRTVEAVYEDGSVFEPNPVQIGWRITPGALTNSIGSPPAEVIAWFEEAAAKRRKSR